MRRVDGGSRAVPLGVVANLVLVAVDEVVAAAIDLVRQNRLAG
jgi:hypothetical protein